MSEASLFLSAEEIAAALAGRLGDLGAAGGAFGGGLGGALSAGPAAGAAGAAGGASGGRLGGRLGARFTKLDSQRRHWPQPSTPEHLHRLHQFLRAPQQRQLSAPDGSPVVGLSALIGSGSMNLNPCVVEAVWDSSGLQVVAHAREGLIKQRTCEKALDRLQSEVFGANGPTRQRR